MSGACSVVTCSLKVCKPSSTIKPLGCPPWSAECESNRTRTHDSYTTRWDTILANGSADKSRVVCNRCSLPDNSYLEAASTTWRPSSRTAATRVLNDGLWRSCDFPLRSGLGGPSCAGSEIFLAFARRHGRMGAADCLRLPERQLPMAMQKNFYVHAVFRPHRLDV
jgi:hypothetical protein